MTPLGLVKKHLFEWDLYLVVTHCVKKVLDMDVLCQRQVYVVTYLCR